MSASKSPAAKCSAGHDMILRPKKRAAKDEEDSKEDVQGRKAAKGSCHCCGGMLKRNPDFAKVCGTCGARFHTYDCGNRRSEAGFTNFDQCPRVGVLPSSILHASTRPGPVFYTPRPAKVCRTFQPEPLQTGPFAGFSPE